MYVYDNVNVNDDSHAGLNQAVFCLAQSRRDAEEKGLFQFLDRSTGYRVEHLLDLMAAVVKTPVTCVGSNLYKQFSAPLRLCARKIRRTG